MRYLTYRINFIFFKLLQYMCLLVIMLLFVTGIKNNMKNTFTIIGCFPSCKDKNRFIVNPFTLKLVLICAREMVDLSCITLVKQCYAMTRFFGCFFTHRTFKPSSLHYNCLMNYINKCSIAWPFLTKSSAIIC